MGNVEDLIRLAAGLAEEAAAAERNEWGYGKASAEGDFAGTYGALWDASGEVLFANLFGLSAEVKPSGCPQPLPRGVRAFLSSKHSATLVTNLRGRSSISRFGEPNRGTRAVMLAGGGEGTLRPISPSLRICVLPGSVEMWVNPEKDYRQGLEQVADLARRLLSMPPERFVKWFMAENAAPEDDTPPEP